MTNSNNWIRVLILKQSSANAAGAKCPSAQPLAQLLREVTIRLFIREALEVKPVSKSDDTEWLILLADAEKGGEVLVLPPEPVVLADGISVQFGSISEAQEKSQFEKDCVIVSKEEIREISSEVDVNGSVTEAAHPNGHLENAIDAATAVGKQLQDITLESGSNGDVHENDLVSKSAIQMQLSSAFAADTVDNSLCQNSNPGVEVEANNSKLPEQTLQAVVNADSENQFIADVDKNGLLSGTDEESRDEEIRTEQSTMKFWQYFVGNADAVYLRENLCAISNTLFPDTQQFGPEQIQQLVSVGSRDLSPPLIRVAEVLLSKARRYQPLHDIIEKLDDFAAANDLGFAIDSKGLVLLLQHYLPPVKARQLYQRLAEQNSPLSFAARLPNDHGSGHHTFQILASHFRNLFVANVPILVSTGLPGCTGKSTFLNKCFDCTFAQSSENAFHASSIDVSLSTESKPQLFHIFDCHGELSLPIVQLISSIASVLLVHVSVSAWKDQSSDSPLQQLLAAIDSDCKALILVRDCTESALAKIQSPTFPAPMQARLLGVAPVMRFASDDRNFVKAFPRFLESTLKPLLEPVVAKQWPQYLPLTRYFSLYEQIEEQLSSLLLASANVKLIARSDRSVRKAEQLKQLLLQLPEGEEETRRRIFPRSDKFATLCETEANIGKLSQQYGEDMKLREELLQLEGEIRSYNRLSQLLSEILAIARSPSLQMYEEFLAVVSLFRFSAAAASPESSLTSTLPPEFFWRELLLFAKFSEPELLPGLQAFVRILLAWGYPIEIINGDTLTFIDTEFLAGILASETHKKLLVVSVIGPQSSGKSTLMNHLFGSGFAVSAGRCTKGMYLSIFETSTNERIAVLDSEGLLSMATRGTAFDKQMAVMLLALSHVVLVNVKGEIGIDMDNILEVALLGMKMLKVTDSKPKLLVVLRDLADLSIAKQMESISRVEEGMKSICDRIKFDFTRVDQSCYELMPCVFADRGRKLFHSGPIHSPNDEFLLRVDHLFERIREVKATPEDCSETAATNVDDWVAHSRVTWGTLRQCGNLLHYKTLQEYFDREALSQLTGDLSIHSDELFRNDAMKLADSILANPSAISSMPQQLCDTFYLEAGNIASERLRVTMETFAKAVANRNFSQEIVDEYQRCLQHRSRMALHSATCEFYMKLRRFMVNDCVQTNIDCVKQHIDEYVRMRGGQSSDEAGFAAEFDLFWEHQAAKMRADLTGLKKSPDEIARQLWSAFNDLITKNTRFSTYSNNLLGHSVVGVVEHLLACKELGQYVIVHSRVRRVMRKAKNMVVEIFTDAKDSIRATFEASLQEIHAGVQKIVANTSAIFSAQDVQRGLHSLEELIRSFDKTLQEHGANFDLSYFTLWFSFLLLKYHEKFVSEEDVSVASNLQIFESHRKQLFSTFIGLLRSRYSDIDSTKTLAKLIVAQFATFANDLADGKFVTRLRNVARLQPEHLTAICESQKHAAHVFAYILDSAKFMGDVFEERFRITKEELMPEFQSMMQTTIGQLVADLHAAVNAWHASLLHDEIQARLLARDEQERQAMKTWLFCSLKAFLSGAKHPSGAESFINVLASSNRPSFANVFQLIPNAFVICDPGKFCELLHNDVDQIYANHDVQFSPQADPLAYAMVELRNNAVGCPEKCPLCGAKCSSPNDGHTKHQTKHHRMTAFAGVHQRYTRQLTFFICTSNEAYKHKWHDSRYDDEDGREVYLPFEEFMSRSHSDWVIPLIPDAAVETKNIFRWMQVKDDLIEHFNRYGGRDLRDNTPREWSQVLRRHCPLCIRPWAQCSNGRNHRMPCGHWIGVQCLATLQGCHAAEQTCPMCAGPLE